MHLDTLRFELHDRVAVVTLARPERLNAMNVAMWADLRTVCEEVEARWPHELRVMVFTGEGRSFCVGGDVDDFATLVSEQDRSRYLENVLAVYERIETLPVPTVAAVHGHALGGGCELTLVCDLVVADETATFGLPETRLGLFPGVAVARGVARVTSQWLKYLVFTGQAIDAATAAGAGLVNEVVPAGRALERATEIASTIAASAPLAISTAKALINQGSPGGYGDSLVEIPRLMGTADHAEGLAALVERRMPEFRGE